jgi:hypothetical protein
MQTLPSEFTSWCGQCNTHLALTPELLKKGAPQSTGKIGLYAEHSSHTPLRQVGLNGDGLFWWIYGEFGTHKTRFIRTFPKPIRIEDTDLGTRSIKEDIDKGGIDVLYWDSDNEETYAKVLEDIANFKPAAYRTLAIDSGSELEKCCLAKSRGVSGHEFTELSDWNPGGERFGKLVRTLRWYSLAYGTQVIITSNEEVDKEYPKGGAYIMSGGKLVAQEPTSLKGLPDLAGKWAKKSARLVDVIGHARMINNQPALCFIRESIGGGGAFWEVKDRTGKLDHGKGDLGLGIYSPDWNKLWEVIKGATTNPIPSNPPR